MNSECVATVRFLGSLGRLLGGSIKVCLHKPETSLWELISAVEAQLNREVRNIVFIKYGEAGLDLSPKVIVFINNVDARLLGGARARIMCGDVVAVIPVIHGG